MTLRIGVVGCGSVFWTPYMSLIERLKGQGRVEVTAVYDIDEGRRRASAERLGLSPGLQSEADVYTADDVDLVLVLTSMPAHGQIAIEALGAGKHVLVEKPLATTLAEAQELLDAARAAPGHLLCAPHVLLAPTYRTMHRRVRDGDVGTVVSVRARYGWSGPDWGRWFYEAGGGALFDLGVYNVTSVCGFMGSVKRVTALAGVAIPQRVVEGELMDVSAEDNAHVLLDFGDARHAVVTTGFTLQAYRSPAVELYGTEGTIQMLGHDWAPEGYELYRNSVGHWELFEETDPTWPWMDGLRHLVECIENGTQPVIRPEHAYHALEIMLAAQAAGKDGVAREIHSAFPEPDFSQLPALEANERVHDPRSAS